MLITNSKTRTTLLRCYPDNIEDFEGCPETAVVTLAPELYDRAILLAAEVARLKVQSIMAATACVKFHAWDEGGGGMETLGEELPTDTHRLHVTRDGIWFSGCREVSRRRFRTTRVDVKQFREAMAPEVDAENEDRLETQWAWEAEAKAESEAWEAEAKAAAAWKAADAAAAEAAERREFVVRNKEIWRQYQNTTNEQRNSPKR